MEYQEYLDSVVTKALAHPALESESQIVTHIMSYSVLSEDYPGTGRDNLCWAGLREWMLEEYVRGRVRELRKESAETSQRS